MDTVMKVSDVGFNVKRNTGDNIDKEGKTEFVVPNDSAANIDTDLSFNNVQQVVNEIIEKYDPSNAKHKLKVMYIMDLILTTLESSDLDDTQFIWGKLLELQSDIEVSVNRKKRLLSSFTKPYQAKPLIPDVSLIHQPVELVFQQDIKDLFRTHDKVSAEELAGDLLASSSELELEIEREELAIKKAWKVKDAKTKVKSVFEKLLGFVAIVLVIVGAIATMQII